MTSSENIDALERIFDYRFKSKDLPFEALTAAGIDGTDNYDGHRRLAQIGVDVVGICLAFDGFQTKSNPRETAVLKQRLCSYEHRVHVAQRTTIDKYVIYNTKPGGRSPKVAAKALSAIIAAVYLDCGSHQTTWERMQHIGFLVQQNEGINPALLESQANGEIGIPTVMVLSGDSQLSQNHDDSSLGKRATISLWSDNENPGVKQPPKSNWANFLRDELQKSRIRGLPSPGESFYRTSVQMQIQELKGERSIEISKRLLLVLASPQSVVILQEVIRSWRNQLGIGFWQPLHLMSKAATFEVIEGISRDIVCLHLVRRYYILSLFEECGGSETPSCSGFVEMSGNPVAVKRLKGNPRNRAEAEVTGAMLREIFPNLQQGTREYEKKITLVKSYRQIARRFSILTQKFGRGILALIPYNEVPGETDLGISDNMISRVPESTFLAIVSILEQSQGDILRDFSTATLKFVDALLSNSAQQYPTFALETIETSHILEQPKNSLELLGCLM
ncbi:hypothetical protein BDW59DRAFT_175227 [Aspergillus cavernicola]|uniref:RNase III domain-containing protein n=1 Tax=Aspergillus cavernicola TaxID=176166 RepID=A0ABR4HRY9_9EURO